MEKRLLVGLVVAFAVGPASWAWDYTVNWPFTTAGNYTVSDATKVEVVDGAAKLIPVDQTDDDNTSTGFGGGTHNQTQRNMATGENFINIYRNALFFC